MRAFGQIFAGGFEVKSLQRESGVVRGGAVRRVRSEEGRRAWDFRAAEMGARRRRSARSANEPVSEESRPVRGCIPEVADPGGRDNAREVTVIRMAQLRSASPVVQKRAFSARPRVSHL